VGDRTYQLAAARTGTMFAFSPPSVKIPWIRSSGAMCWRSAATFMYPSTAASRAFSPFSGAAAACAALPV